MKIPPRIGFVGIGIMGLPMAKNLIKNGYKIKVYNRTREKCYPLEKEGAEISCSVKEISQISNVIITMLENEEALDAVCFGKEGIIENLSAGSYLINTSTVSYEYAVMMNRECFKKGIKYIDSPVSGSKPLAETASLIMLCGCEKDWLDHVKPILLSMGKDIVYCGTAGKGTAMKLCVNLLLSAMNMGLSESVKLCEKSGIAPSLFFEVIEKSPVLNCGYYKIKKDKLIQKDFSPQFSLKNMLKDLGFINKFSRNLNFDGLLARELFKIYEAAFKEGYYNEDLTSVSKIYDKK